MIITQIMKITQGVEDQDVDQAKDPKDHMVYLHYFKFIVFSLMRQFLILKIYQTLQNL